MIRVEQIPLLRAIAANIVKDGIGAKFIEMTDAERLEVTKAYLAAQDNKNERLQTMFLTRPDFQAEFTALVLRGLRETR